MLPRGPKPTRKEPLLRMLSKCTYLVAWNNSLILSPAVSGDFHHQPPFINEAQGVPLDAPDEGVGLSPSRLQGVP